MTLKFVFLFSDCPQIVQGGKIEPVASCSCSGHKGWSFCPSTFSNESTSSNESISLVESTITLNHLYLATELVVSIPSNLQWNETGLQLEIGTQAGLHSLAENEVI